MRARVGAAAMIAGMLTVAGAARAGATGDRTIDRLDFTTASTPYNLPPGLPPGLSYAINVQCPGDRVPFDASISGGGSVVGASYTRSTVTLQIYPGANPAQGTVTTLCLGTS